MVSLGLVWGLPPYAGHSSPTIRKKEKIWVRALQSHVILTRINLAIELIPKGKLIKILVKKARKNQLSQSYMNKYLQKKK